MFDHDQRFKALIREFFPDLLELFFSSWTDHLDLSAVDWMDKELLPNPPGGSRHQLDMVARVRTKCPPEGAKDSGNPESLAVIHIEVESADRTTSIKKRPKSYYTYLSDKYDLPVLPILIYLNVGMKGIGVDRYAERFGKLQVLRIKYVYVGLPALDALEYARGNSWLGVALSSLMRMPPDKVVELGLEAMERLTDAPLTDQQRFLLTDCLEAYLPMTPEQAEEFARRQKSDRTLERVSAMNKTTYDRGIEKGFEQGVEKGIEKGIEKGTQNAILRLGRKQFGILTSELESQVRSIHDLNLLEELLDRIPNASSWEDLLSR